MLYAKIFSAPNKTLEVHVVRQYEDRDGGENLLIRIEHEECRDHYSEWHLPDVYCCKSYGFSEDETFDMENYLRNNESIIWDDWREEKNDAARP